MARSRVLRLCTLALAALLADPLAAQPFSFALFGDTPYSRWERDQLPAMMADMAQQGAAFAVHAGDIKSGSTLCNDEVYQDILGVFQAAPLPLVYVPGDNEWTDCHRRNNGGYDPVERLAHLRSVFFRDEQTLGQHPFPLERQSRDPAYATYRENVRWERGSVLFVGLHVPGSHNNYHGVDGRSGPVSEFIERNAANRAWLTEAFGLARSRKLAGVLIVIQANPELEAAAAGRVRPGYRDLIEQLRQETQAYAGQVVLVHGDTHSYQINQPLLDATGQKVLENFTRVEVYGYPFMGWVRARVDLADPRVFSFAPQRWNPQPASPP